MFLNFRKKKKLSEQEVKWNLLWQKYADGNLEKSYYVLCDYHAGINGGGHNCYFDNKGEELPDYIQALKILLSDAFIEKLNCAYTAYIENTNADEMCDSADDYFYANEQEIIDILQSYANSL